MARALLALWGLGWLLLAVPIQAQPATAAPILSASPVASSAAVAGGGASGVGGANAAGGDDLRGGREPEDAEGPAPSSSVEATAGEPRAAGLRRGAGVSPYDQNTPRQTVAGLMAAVESERLGDAVRYLDLRGMRWGERSPSDIAALIAEVLKRRVWIDLRDISDAPEGDPSDGEDIERIATVEVEGEEVTIALTRVERGKQRIWLVSPLTVAQAPKLAESLGTSSWVMRFVPDHLQDQRWNGLWVWQWIGFLIAVVVGFPAGWLIATFIFAFLIRFAERTEREWDDAVVRGTRSAARFIVAWAAMSFIVLSLNIPTQLAAHARPWLFIPMILTAGWVTIQIIRATTRIYLEKVPDDQEMQSRGLRTQLVILRKIGSVAVGLVTISLALMQFDVVRNIGWSLLASAGVAGVALGFAAQKSLGAVIAGLQLSVTQPIRLGDAVIVQNQWGEIEEITLTYVRIKLWDERRMVVPVDKFLTEIFENWSKPGDSLIGIIELAVDPTAPVPKLRAELERLAAEHPAHDGRDCRLQLIDVNEHRMLLRGRVSTSEISEAFAMRCDIREAMMDYLQRLDGGRYIARQRFERVERLEEAGTVDAVETEAST